MQFLRHRKVRRLLTVVPIVPAEHLETLKRFQIDSKLPKLRFRMNRTDLLTRDYKLELIIRTHPETLSLNAETPVEVALQRVFGKVLTKPMGMVPFRPWALLTNVSIFPTISTQ